MKPSVTLTDRRGVRVTFTQGSDFRSIGSGIQAAIIGGKMRRTDTLTWNITETNPPVIYVYGLYRGRYGQFEFDAALVVAALDAIATRDGASIRNAFNANGIELDTSRHCILLNSPVETP